MTRTRSVRISARTSPGFTVPGENEARVEATKVLRILERARDSPRFCEWPMLPIVRTAGGFDRGPVGGSRGSAGSPGYSCGRSCPRGRPLRRRLSAKLIRDHEDPRGRAVGRSLKSTSHPDECPVLDEPGRYGAVGQDVLEPENPRYSPSTRAGHRRHEGWEARRDGDDHIWGLKRRRGQCQCGCETRLLADALHRRTAADPQWQAEDPDTVAPFATGFSGRPQTGSG